MSLTNFLQMLNYHTNICKVKFKLPTIYILRIIQKPQQTAYKVNKNLSMANIEMATSVRPAGQITGAYYGNQTAAAYGIDPRTKTTKIPYSVQDQQQRQRK